MSRKNSLKKGPRKGELKRRRVRRRNLPRILLGLGLFVLAAMAAVLVVIHRNRSRPAWYVEAGLEKQWGELVEKASPPPPFTGLRVYDPQTGIKKGRCGIIISKDFLTGVEPNSNAHDEGNSDTVGADAWEPPVRVFPRLYQDRGDYQGTIPLALNPWLIFRKTGDPQLTLERVRNPAGGPGVLILPGSESGAVHAWITQLLQESPGAFPLEKQAWDEAEQGLTYGNRRFQQGALTYAWFDVWFLLLSNETAWVYAPLSMTRDLSSYDTGRLDAALFPIPRDWNTYGLQADVLWAIPEAPAKQEPKLDGAKAWLAAPETQALIADILGWVPAHPGGRPRDTLARQAQVAWFSSSFVWQ
jgi:hypothetical protein